MIYLVETLGAQPLLVHGLCVCLLLGRATHAFGVSRMKEDYRFRVSGMALTFTTLIVAAGWLLMASLRVSGA